jgi:hypothetical protein
VLRAIFDKGLRGEFAYKFPAARTASDSVGNAFSSRVL